MHAVPGAIWRKQQDLVAARVRKLRSPGVCNGFFYITNAMHDETQLWLRRKKKAKGGKKRCRVLAASGQVSYGDIDRVKEDIDIIRQPEILPEYTALQCASALARPDDPTGLCPCSEVLPPAKFVGSLMATESHTDNKLVSKFVVAQPKRMPGSCLRCHAPSYCCQRKVWGGGPGHAAGFTIAATGFCCC